MKRVLTTLEFAAVLKLTYVENCLRSAIKFIEDDSLTPDSAIDKTLIATRLELQATLEEVASMKDAIKRSADESST